jgi:hypothetical protein
MCCGFPIEPNRRHLERSASGNDDETPKKGTRGRGKSERRRTVRRKREPRPQLERRSLAFGVWTWDSPRHYLGKQTTRAQLEQVYVFMGVLSRHSCGPTALELFIRGIAPSSLSTMVDKGWRSIIIRGSSSDTLCEEGVYKRIQ